jgi:hypothetical protein
MVAQLPPASPLLPPMRTTLVSHLRSITTSVTGTTWLVLLRCRQIYVYVDAYYIFYWFFYAGDFGELLDRPLPWWKRRSAILVFEIVDLIRYVSQ